MEIGKHLSNLRRQVFDLAEEDSESIDIRSSTTSLSVNSDIMNEIAINNKNINSDHDDNKLLAVTIGPTIKPLVNIVSPDPAFEEEERINKNTSSNIDLIKATGATPQAQLMTYAVEAQPYHSQIRSDISISNNNVNTTATTTTNNDNNNSNQADMKEYKIQVKVESHNQDLQKPLEADDLGFDTMVDYEEDDHVRVEDSTTSAITSTHEIISNNIKKSLSLIG